MYGFYIYIDYNTEKSTDFNDVIAENADLNIITFDNYTFHYRKFEKFQKDKVFAESDKYIIGLDGVILNAKSLQKQFLAKDQFELIAALYEKEKNHFPSNLKGVFSGFVFSKKNRVLYFFNDKTATKQVFYAQFNDKFVIAPAVESITTNRSKNGLNNNLSIQSTYNLLTFGGMIEKHTLVEDIYKLGAGEYLFLDKKELISGRYLDFNDVAITINNKPQAIKRLNETFSKALKLEYQKDEEYNYKHIATLSGGLDSRMNVMLANKMGFKPDTFCFSQSNYSDEKIARKIAKDLALTFDFIPLDGGDYLKNLEEMVSINSGLQFYHGSAHFHYALQQMNLSDFGLMHTGQVGDAILGGLVSGVREKNYLSKAISNRFMHKIEKDDKLFSRYRDEEVFKLHQRLFNLTNFGSYTVEQHQTYLVSPFLDDEVIKTALSINPELKYDQRIYLDWINQLHPEITKYKWERTRFRPNKAWKTSFSRYTNKIRKEYLLFTNQKDKLSMNPTDYWFESNITIKEFYYNYFNTNIGLVKTNLEVYNDLELMFKEGNLMEKAIVITLLEVIRKNKLIV